jgi:hypothetical protein
MSKSQTLSNIECWTEKLVRILDASLMRRQKVATSATEVPLYRPYQGQFDECRNVNFQQSVPGMFLSSSNKLYSQWEVNAIIHL